MSGVLIDTNIFIRLASQGLKGVKSGARRILQDCAHHEIVLSTASITEIAIKNKIGKLDMNGTEVAQVISDLQLTLLPFKTEHAMRLFSMPLHHRDPFDRMIIAAAYAEHLPVVSADEKFPLYEGLLVVPA